ncbi:MAG: HAD family hydrolase [Parasphingopyxis sp.]|uniref:sulfotransferase-like domain-containing protein n=1 Tax=Parasphingopyxis sp. TaxID=1920299 RepID=UPI003F9F1940
MTIRIAMWSGPRNISTAMMRSFGSRADCHVSDEPYYGAYLKDTGFAHPMADAIIADMDCDWRSITKTLNGDPPDGSAIWYQKHMPSEMVGPVDIGDLNAHRHAFLIRDPKRMIASYAKKMEAVTFEDMGLERLHLYFRMEADRLGKAPPVIEGADILDAPGPMLEALCKALDIPWYPSMLHWEPGRRDTDGIWAPHWYNRVEASTGFEGDDRGPVQLPDEYRALYERCRPHYEALRAHKLTA